MAEVNHIAHVTLKAHHLFATPDSFEVIEQWINKHPAEDRIHLWTAAMMTWNYASKLIAEAEDA